MGYWNVSTSSPELLLRFSSGSKPIAHKVDPSEPAIRPDGLGYMGLSAAACWIACEAGAGSFFTRDKEAWSAAFAKLLPAIADGNVEIIGRQKTCSDSPTVLTVVNFRRSPLTIPIRIALAQILSSVMKPVSSAPGTIGRTKMDGNIIVTRYGAPATAGQSTPICK